MNVIVGNADGNVGLNEVIVVRRDLQLVVEQCELHSAFFLLTGARRIRLVRAESQKSVVVRAVGLDIVAVEADPFLRAPQEPPTRGVTLWSIDWPLCVIVSEVQGTP